MLIESFRKCSRFVKCVLFKTYCGCTNFCCGNIKMWPI